jgi:hypothetical protein
MSRWTGLVLVALFAFMAFGALIWYLTHLVLDRSPLVSVVVCTRDSSRCSGGSHVVMACSSTCGLVYSGNWRPLHHRFDDRCGNHACSTAILTTGIPGGYFYGVLP